MLALNVVRSWNLGVEPAAQLDIPKLLESVREWALTPGAVTHWLQTNLLENDQWLELVAEPDPQWSDALADWQERRAKELAAALSEPGSYHATAQALQERQAEVDDEKLLADPASLRHRGGNAASRWQLGR